jgi:hypothetical protein
MTFQANLDNIEAKTGKGPEDFRSPGCSTSCATGRSKMRPNPSLHPKRYSGLRQPPPSGELKR